LAETVLWPETVGNWKKQNVTVFYEFYTAAIIRIQPN